MKTYLFLFIFCSLAMARYRAVPLMPLNLETRKSNSNLQTKTLASITFGMYGGGSLSSTEPLGLQWLWGGKIDYRIPILIDNLRIRPSLGYFRKSESEGAVTISQNIIDLGLGADYKVLHYKSFALSLGLLNHLDLLLSRVSLYESSGNSPLGFRYRVAPLAGAQIHLTKTLILALDFEYGILPLSTLRTYGAWSVGIAFPF